MNQWRVKGAAVALLVFGVARPAAAACGATCSGDVQSIELAPALDCVSLDWSLNDCGCRIAGRIDNECAGEVSLSGDGLTCTSNDGCVVVAPGDSSGFRLQVQRAGVQEWSLSLDEEGGGQHTMTITANVTAYDDSPDDGCTLAAGGAPNPGALLFACVTALLALLSRRRQQP